MTIGLVRILVLYRNLLKNAQNVSLPVDCYVSSDFS